MNVDVDVTQATVVKAGNAFCIAGRDGELPEGEHALGAFVDDCRHLRTHALRICGAAPRLLAASDDSGTLAVHELTNPELELADGRRLPRQALRIRVERRIRPDGLDETILLRSHHREPAELEVELALDADFVPMLELRGLLDRLERSVERVESGATLRLSCAGADGVTRATTVSCEGATAGGGGLRAHMRLEPGESRTLTVACAFSGEPAAVAAGGEPWVAAVATDDPLVDRTLRRSLLDLQILISELDGQRYPAAGIPWYATLFGRDSLLTALQVLAFDPGLAAGTLRLLAAHQGTAHDDRRDEQPGKILHELRLGEVARTERTPFARYYGTVDATALFLILLCRHADWTGSLALFEELRPSVDAALGWLDGHAGGLITYERRAPGGLQNQGWKDSPDGVPDEHGQPLTGAIALVEAQGYAIRAREDVAALLERTGDEAGAARARAAAVETHAALERLWLADLGGYAIGLDGDGRASRALGSNQGHLLWAAAVARERAKAIRDRVMDGDLFSGWGVRTLGTGEAAFNPHGYHTGTVWPHDTAMIAAGLREYGFDADFQRVADGLLEAATAFPEHRLPELFAGLERTEREAPVPYPVACRPQAWAAGAVPYLLVCALGLVPRGLERTLHLRRPLLPGRMGALTVSGLQVAGATVDLRFERETPGEPAAVVTATRVDGDLDVVVER